MTGCIVSMEVDHAADDATILDRLCKVYAEMVDQTENRATTRDVTRSERLKDLLVFTEYVLGIEDDNPLDDWFE